MSMRLAYKRSLEEAAGSDESEEEVVAKAPPKKRQSKAKTSSSSASKATAAASRKSAASYKDDSDEDSEEEVRRPSSRARAPSQAPILEVDDGYDENFYGDEADREELSKMTEMERENVLYERAEKRKELHERAQVQRRIAASRSQSASASKVSKAAAAARKAGSSKPAVKSDDGEDLSSESESSDASVGKNRRIRKGQSDAQVASSRRSSKKYSSDSSSESESDDGRGRQKPTTSRLLRTRHGRDSADSDSSASESESDRDRRGSRRRGSEYDRRDSQQRKGGSDDEEEEEGDPTLIDLNTYRIARDALEKWVGEPYFSDAVVGHLVRLGVGVLPGTDEPVYRVAEIVGVKAYKKQYRLPNNKIVGDALELSLAGSLKVWTIDRISNHQFKPQEHAYWLEKCKEKRHKIPGPQELRKRREALERRVKGHNYTPDEVNKMVKSNMKTKSVVGKVSFRKEEVENQIRRAESTLSDLKEKLEQERSSDLQEQVAKLEKDLEGLLARKHEIIALAMERAQAGQAVAEKVKKVNLRNQRANWDAEAAEIKRREEEEIRKKAGLKKGFDPFARRACRPKILWSVGGAKKEVNDAASEPSASDAPYPDHTSASESQSQEPRESQDTLSGPPEPPSNLVAHHSFGGVDIMEQAAQRAAEMSTEIKRKEEEAKRASSKERKGLSLGDYLKAVRKEHLATS